MSDTGKTDDGYWGQLAKLETITPELFDPHVGESFQVRTRQHETNQTHVRPLDPRIMLPRHGENSDASDLVDVVLVEVTRYAGIRDREGGFDHRPREPFALLFEAPADTPLMGAQLEVRHAQLGAGQLFFSAVQVNLKQPHDGKGDRAYYEVIFG